MAKKDLFIHAIHQVEVDGSKNIPTALHHPAADKFIIGYDALAATNDLLNINQDFKVDLGRHDSQQARQNQSFRTASGSNKSAYVMTNDFVGCVLKDVSRWLQVQQVEEAAHVLIAEPLAMHEEADPKWLENYRRNLREMLEGRSAAELPNIHFQEVSFLPEPFAVFQYYRYGINHPLMSEAAKHQALILDFGGGTFDVCVIETTKEGDISRTGRNSKPFGASSVTVGGFYINRKIAEHLYREHLISGAKKDQFKNGLKVYERWRRNELDLEAAREDLRTFALNFHRTSLEVEQAKVSLCKQVQDWSFETPLAGLTRLTLPSDPFVERSQSKIVPLSATEMRTLFRKEIWEEKLRPTVDICLKRAAQELAGQPISIVLLSGGSANIGWLREALFQDFSGLLAEAQVLPLPDFQEVVSKGLAVECARRFFTNTGDFSSVVYNRLCLMLDVKRADDSGDCRPRPMRPVTKDLPNADQAGVLLQSASAIQAFIDTPMKWKVGQMGALPKRMDYFFMRSSLDPEDLENRLNFEETSIRAPSKAQFDQELKVELLVKEDGTAIPKFIYHAGQSEKDTISTEGQAFALDVTYRATAPNAKAYIGFDFGTSNSSVSFVDSRSIKEYQRRKGENSWLQLSQLAYELPYPLADPLLAFLAPTVNKERLMNAARQAFEAMLTMCFYAALADFRLWRKKEGKRDKSRVFGSLTQRSAGPLWAALRQLFTQQGFGKKAAFTGALVELFEEENSKLLGEFATFIAQAKHDKVELESVDAQRPLQVLGNICARIFRRASFGFFEHLAQKKFSKQITGQFRIAHGQPPFINTHPIELTALAPEIMPYLMIPEANIAVPLSPMIFWWQDPRAQYLDHGCCYLFDGERKSNLGFSFKTVGRPEQLTVTSDHNDLSDLFQQLSSERLQDGDIEAIEIKVIMEAES